MSYPSSGNHWGIFLILVLLLLGHPRSYERRRHQLSSVTDATRNSLNSLNEGMDSLQAGMHQISAPAILPENAQPVTEAKIPDPQIIMEEEITVANLSLV